jgi:hypothetical protein
MDQIGIGEWRKLMDGNNTMYSRRKKKDVNQEHITKDQSIEYHMAALLLSGFSFLH